MSIPIKNMIGHTYGRWLVLSDEAMHKAKCQCQCGVVKIIDKGNLVKGMTLSCGCLRKELQMQHGNALASGTTKEYNAWKNMRRRCDAKSGNNYRLYASRGIVYFLRWTRFISFLADVGVAPSPHHTLDRINNDGNYEPGNVRWATPKQQSSNKRDNLWFTYNGETLILQEWAKKLGLSPSAMKKRINKWPLERAFSEPVGLNAKRPK